MSSSTGTGDGAEQRFDLAEHVQPVERLAGSWLIA